MSLISVMLKISKREKIFLFIHLVLLFVSDCHSSDVFIAVAVVRAAISNPRSATSHLQLDRVPNTILTTERCAFVQVVRAELSSAAILHVVMNADFELHFLLHAEKEILDSSGCRDAKLSEVFPEILKF